MQEANKRIVQRAFDAWDEGRADLFDEVYAEDVAHPQMNLAEDVPVLKQMKDILRNWVEAFPDQSHDVHHMIAEEDWVATRFSMSGTHLGRWKDIEPTGAEFEIEGMAMERVEDGKIVERWLIEDMLDFYQRLGVVSGDGARRNIAVVRRFFEGLNGRDREAVRGLLAKDFVSSDLDAESFVDLEFAFFDMFPDLAYTLQDVFGSGKKVTSRWRFIGRHTGKGGPGIFQEAEPTGKKVDVTGMSIATVEEGKIVQWWGEWDGIGLHRELGTLTHLVE